MKEEKKKKTQVVRNKAIITILWYHLKFVCSF